MCCSQLRGAGPEERALGGGRSPGGGCWWLSASQPPPAHLGEPGLHAPGHGPQAMCPCGPPQRTPRRLAASGSTRVSRGLAGRLWRRFCFKAGAGVAPSSDWVRALWSLLCQRRQCGHLSAGGGHGPRAPRLGTHLRCCTEQLSLPRCLAGAPEAAPGGCCCCSGTCQAAGCHRCAAAQSEPASCVLRPPRLWTTIASCWIGALHEHTWGSCRGPPWPRVAPACGVECPARGGGESAGHVSAERHCFPSCCVGRTLRLTHAWDFVQAQGLVQPPQVEPS